MVGYPDPGIVDTTTLYLFYVINSELCFICYYINCFLTVENNPSQIGPLLEEWVFGSIPTKKERHHNPRENPIPGGM
jgi:hypothetical protein